MIVISCYISQNRPTQMLLLLPIDRNIWNIKRKFHHMKSKIGLGLHKVHTEIKKAVKVRLFKIQSNSAWRQCNLVDVAFSKNKTISLALIVRGSFYLFFFRWGYLLLCEPILFFIASSHIYCWCWDSF